ncbi:hypothetical protein GALMADRAFT_145600 [Galerina marginata CBS 339.88]|uniref:DUF6534 domain-containing protein n=1 Tax=Galerina marginata (strain CBS 339.88) TaxID=685588 RepID=A0A067SQY2_GALM3|nr:hypothetical protein GALMADRAFT_145600 [Galerina marginata CBS 339.88]
MSNSTALPPIPADLIEVAAPQLIGILFNWALFGVLSVQTYVYYLNFPDDNRWNKVLVYGSYIFEIVQTAMTAADVYYWYASGFGNANHLGNVHLSPADTPLLCGIIAATVQWFFAYRIFTLRRSYLWICILIVLTSVVQTAGAFGTSYRAFKLQDFDRFHENIYFPQSFDVWLIGDTVCDILIAGTMLWLFHTSQHGGINHGKQILGKLVRLVVETNTLTAGMALVSFICYVTLPDSNLFVCLTIIMGKLYSNTLLVTFNNRIALRKVNPNKDVNYDSGGSGRTPIRKPNDFGGNLNTFHVGSDSFGGKSVGIESYEIATLSSDKVRDITLIGSEV